MQSLSFWAQALDNTSPDHFMQDEHMLDDDSQGRQGIAQSVSRVKSNGSRAYDESGVILVVHRTEFVLEFPCEERDDSGRVSPIVCHGTFGDRASAELNAFVINEAKRFALEAHRPLSEATQSNMTEALGALKKNQPTLQPKLTCLLMGVLSMAAGLAAYKFL